MLLDSAHRVLLYDPNNPGTPGATIDPGNVSALHYGMRTQPLGDIPMGNYQNSPVIP